MENEATLTTNTNTNTNNVNLPPKSKKKSALNIIRVALYMIRRRSNGKNDSAHVEVASKGLWKKVVAAVHPLHNHHHHHLPTSRKPPPAIDMDHKIIGKDFGYVDSYPNRSPNYLASPASSSSSSSAKPSQYASALNLQELDKNDHPSSRYASALNLQELDKNGECENNEIVIENGDSDEQGDDMIDEKAEEFIANFYEQMRLQRIRSANGYKK